MKYGKISSDEIERYIKPHTGYDTGNLVLGPHPGIDAGVVKLGTRFLAASIDPITATSNMVGEWCVYVTTNDVFVTGLEPRWFLLTLILPHETSNEDLNRIMVGVDKALKRVGSSLIGGHTEWTPGIQSPLAIGTSIGIGDTILNPRDARPGDKLILFGDPGLEGAYIIYLEKPEVKKILESDEEKYIARTPEKISVVDIVRRLRRYIGSTIVYMHDPTEGGILNGSYEISLSTGYSVNIYSESLSTHPAIIKIAQQFSLNPYKLLSSGSLIAVARDIDEEKAEDLGGRIIGEILETKGPALLIDGKEIDTLNIEKDDVWRVVG